MESLPPGIDPANTPIAPNPNGDPPNFIDPPSLGPAVLAVGLTLIISSSVFVTLRLITNFKTVGRLGLDDCLCLFAYIGGIGYWALIHNFAEEGAARHMWDTPVSVVTREYIQKQYALQMIIGPTMWASKAAILALYIRIFGTVRWLRLVSYGLIIFMFLFYWSNIVIASIYCIPRNGAPWDVSALGSCSSQGALFIANGVFGVVADLVLFILPFPVIYGLQLGRRKKIGLWIVFLAGVLTIVTSVASLAYKVRVILGNDLTWNGINVTITTFVEVFGTVIVSCAPALFSFWSNIFTKSKLYSNLRSGLLSRISRSTNRKGGSIECAGEGVDHFSSSSNSKHNHTYDQLDDDVSARQGGPHTKIYSMRTFIPLADGITKSTHITKSLSYSVREESGD